MDKVQEYVTMQRDTMQDAIKYMIKLKPGVIRAIERFREGKNKEAINMSSYIEEGLQWLMEVARLTKDVQSENMSEADMENKLDMFIEAYKNEDYTLMGDILEFEILPLLEKWDNVINIVAKN
jgi:hypothetical protein